MHGHPHIRYVVGNSIVDVVTRRWAGRSRFRQGTFFSQKSLEDLWVPTSLPFFRQRRSSRRGGQEHPYIYPQHLELPTVCRDGLHWWLCHHSVRSMTLWFSVLLSDIFVLTCARLFPFSVIRNRAASFWDLVSALFQNYCFGLVDAGYQGPHLVLRP